MYLEWEKYSIVLNCGTFDSKTLYYSEFCSSIFDLHDELEVVRYSRTRNYVLNKRQWVPMKI